jgi:N-acetylglucosamine-6-phosphate deacetylase
MPGVHLEGPCLSPQRPGVHPPQHLQPLSLEVLRKITTNIVKLITLAPELNPSAEIVQFLSDKKVCVALGHSNATYEEAQNAFAQGVSMMTHTFNAMAPLHHRNPGAVTAALLDDKVWCCVIADGQHLVPPAVQLILRTKGFAKTILVTDIAHVGTSQGGLVGSSILLNEAVENVVKWGFCTFPQAIRMASYNPAKALGWEQKIGVLAPGAAADVVVWDKETLAIKRVISRGQLR